MGVVASVFTKVDGQLQLSGLSGFGFEFRGGERCFKPLSAVGNPHIVGIFGVIDGTGGAVVEVVPIALPGVSHPVRVRWNGGVDHHGLVDFVSVPNIVFRVINNTVAVLVAHQLQGAGQRYGSIGVRQAVTDPPVVAFPSGTLVAFCGDVTATVLVVACFA